jgi:hypothetical protein
LSDLQSVRQFAARFTAQAERLDVLVNNAGVLTAARAVSPDGIELTFYLRQALEIEESEGREIQIAGPDVLSYGEMLDRMAAVLGIPYRPRFPVPLITPWLSPLWIGLVTPVDARVARPLIEGLAVPTVVTDPSAMGLFAIEPVSFDEALRRAVAEDLVLDRLEVAVAGTREGE